VTLNGKTFVPRQGNNSYIFPGIGLGAIMSRSSRITDEMFMGSEHTLASLTTESDLAQGSLYPSLSRVREVSAHIAAGLAKTAHRHGMAKEKEPEDLLAQAHATMYDPHY